MRVLRLVVDAFVLFILLPVTIVAVLGIVFSPLQTSARAVEPRAAFEASDIMWIAAADPEPEFKADRACEPEPEPVFDLEPEVAGGAAEQPTVWAEMPEIEHQASYTSEQLRTQGVIYDGGYRYTWYSQRVLPGGGLGIEGRHVSEEGYVVDAQDRIVVASSDLPHGTELAVPFGTGRAVVLDTGCAPGTIDVYTDF